MFGELKSINATIGRLEIRYKGLKPSCTKTYANCATSAGITDRPYILTLSTLVLAAVTFSFISLWAFSGVRIQGFIHHEPIRKLAY